MGREPIQFRIGIQSRSAFHPTNGRGDYPGMDYSRQNIRHLMGDRSINQLAEAAEIGQTWLQRYLNPDKPSGIQKANPEKLGAVARALGVSLNDLLFVDIAASSAGRASHPAQPDFDKMASAVYLLREYLEIVGEPPEWVADPVMLEIAWWVVEGFGEQVTPNNVIDLTKRLGSKIRSARGQEGDGGQTDSRGGQATGAPRRRIA